jgi:ribosomal protein S18 acetylase RimI-like enzyme
MTSLMLEVDNDNKNAIGFYEKSGFVKYRKATENSVYMLKEMDD